MWMSRKSTASRSQDDRLVFEDERKELTGFSRGYWWKLEKQRLVPQRVRVGQRKIGWLNSELQAWLKERAAARETETLPVFGRGNARPAA